MRVLVKEPLKVPEWREVRNCLETFQDLVGGYIECVPWDDRHLMIVNEEGKINGVSRFNFHWRYDQIFGTAVWVSMDGEEFGEVLDDDLIRDVMIATGYLEELPDDPGEIICDLDLEDSFKWLMNEGKDDKNESGI